MEAATHFAAEGAFSRHRHFLELAEGICRKAGQPQDARKLRAEAAESLVREAEQRQARGDHLVASKFFRDALQLHTDAGSGREVLDRIKVQLEESGRQAVSAMTEITSGPIEIPREAVETIPNQMRPMSLAGCLRALSRYEGWIPSLDRARRTAAENSGRFISQMMPITVFRGEIAALEIVEDAVRVEYEALNLVKMTYQIFAEVQLPAIIAVLQEKGWSAETLSEHLSQGNLFSDGRLQLIRRGLDRYFEGDLFSAIHILVLQVEGIIRDIAGVLGLPTITRRGRRVQVRTLDSLLEDPDVVGALGSDFSALVRVFMTDPQGDNLRNDVAHALLDVNSFTRWRCEVLLMILVRLSAYRATERPQGSTGRGEDREAPRERE